MDGNPEQVNIMKNHRIADLEHIELLLKQGHASQALPLIEHSLGIHPEDVHAQYLLGVGRKMTGDLDGAENAFRQIISCMPFVDRALYGLGLVLEGKGKTNEAIKAWRTALAINPANPGATRKLAERGQRTLSDQVTGGPAPTVKAPSRIFSKTLIKGAMVTSNNQRPQRPGCLKTLVGIALWIPFMALGVFLSVKFAEIILGSAGTIIGGIVGLILFQVIWIRISRKWL
jgi:tetratricopeptide (TPR) repeat protein